MSSPHLVLLVDDDQNLLTALAGGLRRHGYRVAIALDGVAAVSTAAKLKPQAVVLAERLPGGGGTAVLKRMCSFPPLAGVPVVMMGDHDSERSRDEALSAGAVAYLAKPVEVEDLVTALRGVVEEDDGAAKHAHAGKIVLLIDDDEDLLAVLASLLRRRGIRVDLATDAIHAVSCAVKLPPHAVVLDIGLPGGDGMVVMQRFQALPQLAGVPVVVLSGRDPVATRAAAVAAGAVTYLTKPVAAEVFVDAVMQALEGAPAF